jgi:tRNA pseudouridine55 synthase
MFSGMVGVYKEKGFTSHDVVAKMRGILGTRKVGHTGTLDPDAEGVLPVCVGNGTKLCGMLTDWDKEYVAGVTLGVCTDTQDSSGIILQERSVDVTEAQVRAVIEDFARQGGYLQVPPMYSALKVGGKKLYELARAGVEVERQGRPIKIYELELLELQLPNLRIRVKCSKGTYIRTLAADMGEALGCGGMMNSLVRTKVGFLTTADCKTLQEWEKCKSEGTLSAEIMPPDRFFPQALPIHIKPWAMRLLQNGNTLEEDAVVEDMTDAATREEAFGKDRIQQMRVYGENGQFYGIYEFHKEERLLRPVKMFLPC